MPLAFKVQCNLTAEFTGTCSLDITLNTKYIYFVELMEDLRAHNPLLDRVNEHKRILSHHPQHVSRRYAIFFAHYVF